jgi:beta-glucosidase
MVDLVRHPCWGRTQDAYGEDAYQVGRMGTAFAAGVQRHVGACANHLVSSDVEQFRARADGTVDEQTLREIYGRPFEMVVRDGGVACVMTAYNEINGVSSTVNPHLIRDILKAPVAQGGFGSRGLVVSEWWAAPGDQTTPDAATGQARAGEMVNAGLDVEMPWTLNYSYLEQAVAAGAVAADTISDAAARVLEQKARFQSLYNTETYGIGPVSSVLDQASIRTNTSHLALAERAAGESAVLLANGPAASPVLPVRGGVGSIAVIGVEVPIYLISTTPPKSGDVFHFATDVPLGDRGSNRVNANPAESIGPHAGIQTAAAAHGNIVVTAGTSAADATNADLAVVVVGLTPSDEGEEYAISAGGDRATLVLPQGQATLVDEVLALGKPSVVVIESGSMVDVPWLTHDNRNQATIWAGYGGMRAGAALGKLLFGDASFSGKLPFAWVRESSLPVFKNNENETGTTLDYFFGYRDYDHRRGAGQSVDLVFPFGYGLSYTTFSYASPTVPCAEVTPNAVLDVTVDVTNTGSVTGDEIAFAFIAGPPAAEGKRSVKELKSFARVSLDPGATERVHLPVRIQDLKHWSTSTSSWVIDPGEYSVRVGRSADDAELATAGTFVVRE